MRPLEKVPEPGVRGRNSGVLLEQGNCSTSFPKCNLHGCRIVNGFPGECPLSANKPQDALLEMKGRGYAGMDPRNPTPGAITERYNRYSVCNACVSTNLSNPTVRRLRRAQRPPTTPVTVTGSPSNKRPGKRRRSAGSPVYV